MKRLSQADFISGLFFSLFGLFLFLETLKLPSGTTHIPGPQFWPRIIFSGMILLGLFLIGQSLTPPSASTNRRSCPWPQTQKMLLVILTIGIYILLWSLWSFFIPTFVFLFGIMSLLHRQKLIRLAIYSFLITFFIYAGFVWGLHIPLD